MNRFDEMVDLAAERLGGTVVAANDEFFASKDNLLCAAKPIFIDGKFTDRGKWMDGWETRRRREVGYDYCVVRLGCAGVIRGVVVDTSFFRGNFPAECSLDACAVDGYPSPGELLAEATRWQEILPRTGLEGDAQNSFKIDCERRFTHVRFNIFPDGGVARLCIMGEVVPDWRFIAPGGVLADLAAIENGGRVVGCSDMFFGPRHNLIMPGRAANMGDGWETKRRRGPGNDFCVVAMGAAGRVRRIEVDTAHFKGNAPESCLIEGCVSGDDEPWLGKERWHEILPRTRLQPHTRHIFQEEVRAGIDATHVRLSVFPDGGVSRLRLFGELTESGRERAGVRWLDVLANDALEADLIACCASRAWVRHVMTCRPFRYIEGLLSAADAASELLGRDDWLEAFRGHPRIGETARAAAQSELSHVWSTGEQAGVAAADAQLLPEANRAYEARFGHTFIVCATGKTAVEMLALFRSRLANALDVEFKVAVDEQRKITALRLGKLVTR